MTRRHLLIAGTVALVAVAVGIATSSAASSRHLFAGRHGLRHGFAGATDRSGVAGGPFGGFGPRGVIHAVTVVPNSSGGFDTVTIDSGTLGSVSGDELTITEGTKSATYATPTITVPSDATVLLDGSSSTLAALPYGDRVTITQNSDGTSKVFATDASFAPRLGGGPGRRGGFGPRRGGPALGATGSTAFWPPPGSTGPWHHGPGHDVPLWGSSGSSAGPTT